MFSEMNVFNLTYSVFRQVISVVRVISDATQLFKIFARVEGAELRFRLCVFSLFFCVFVVVEVGQRMRYYACEISLSRVLETRCQTKNFSTCCKS